MTSEGDSSLESLAASNVIVETVSAAAEVIARHPLSQTCVCVWKTASQQGWPLIREVGGICLWTKEGLLAISWFP